MTKVKVDFSPLEALNNRGLPNGARLFLANEIVKISDAYTPYRDGYLKNSAVVVNDGRQIQYNVPYARKMWYGKTDAGNDINYIGAPTRGSRWVERAVASNSEQLIASVQRFVNGGGK